MTDELQNSLDDQESTETNKTQDDAHESEGHASVSASVSSDSESKKRRVRQSKRRVAPTADSEGVKFRLTFLMDQSFKGAYYRKGETLEVDEHVFKAYARRKNMLSFEEI